MEWYCEVCDFIYVESEGIPHDNIPPNTRFEDIPESWVCPTCGIDKTWFSLVELTAINSSKQSQDIVHK